MSDGTVIDLRAPGQHDHNKTAQRVALMHETGRVADHTPLATTDVGRLATIVETTGYAAAAVRDSRTDLRAILLALNVQTQLWLNDIDRNGGQAA